MQHKTEPVNMWFDSRVVMRKSPIHGIGVFAAEPIFEGEQLMRVTGGIVYTTEDWKTGKVQLEASMYNESQLDDNLFLAVPKSIFYYVNHSCDPNYWGDHIARRDIQPGEEITTDFALFQAYHAYVLEPCLCGSPLCRGQMTGNDWKLPELQERYKGQFTPYIEELIAQMNNA